MSELTPVKAAILDIARAQELGNDRDYTDAWERLIYRLNSGMAMPALSLARNIYPYRRKHGETWHLQVMLPSAERHFEVVRYGRKDERQETFQPRA